MTFLTLLTNQVILPILFLTWFYLRDTQSRSNFILETLFTSSFVGFAWIIGSQSWTSVYVGIFLLIFLGIGMFKKIQNLPETWDFELGDNWKEIIFTVTQILISLVFLPICIFGLSGYSYDGEVEAIDLEFPLKDGAYITGHGGANPLINYHYVSESQKYSYDISKLNILGTRATGIYPEKLDKYAIYGEPLYSPCSGKVIDLKDGYEDLNPPEKGKAIVLRFMARRQDDRLHQCWLWCIGDTGPLQQPE